MVDIVERLHYAGYNDGRLLEAANEIERLRKDAERMVSWIDGVIEIVELFRPETPSQKEWRNKMVALGYELIQSHVDAAMKQEG